MKPATHAFEVKTVEFVARHLWNVIRPLLKNHLTQRCLQCNLPATYTHLNHKNICSLCEATTEPPITQSPEPPETSAPSSQNQLASALNELLAEHQHASASPYDALLLFSGGKDSTYLLHRITQDYPGLRLCTLLVDNGFMSPIALENANRVLSKFDIPHVHFKPKPSFVHKAFRNALLQIPRQQGYSIVDLIDGYITFDSAKNFAAYHNIPLIICGLSRVQSEHIFGLTSFEFTPDDATQPLTEHASLALNELFDADEMQYWFDGSKWDTSRIPRFIVPFFAWDLDETEVIDVIDRLGLFDKRRSSPLLTNNALIPVIGMAEVAQFGYCSWEIEFARMVREGKSERRYWRNLFEMLEYSTKTGRFVNKTVDQTLAALGLSRADVGIPHGKR